MCLLFYFLPICFTIVLDILHSCASCQNENSKTSRDMEQKSNKLKQSALFKRRRRYLSPFPSDLHSNHVPGATKKGGGGHVIVGYAEEVVCTLEDAPINKLRSRKKALFELL